MVYIVHINFHFLQIVKINDSFEVNYERTISGAVSIGTS